MIWDCQDKGARSFVSAGSGNAPSWNPALLLCCCCMFLFPATWKVRLRCFNQQKLSWAPRWHQLSAVWVPHLGYLVQLNLQMTLAPANIWVQFMRGSKQKLLGQIQATKRTVRDCSKLLFEATKFGVVWQAAVDNWNTWFNCHNKTCDFSPFYREDIWSSKRLN